MELEQPLLQVVGASLSELFRGYAHGVEKELVHVSTTVQQLATKSSSNSASPDDARQQMDALVGRLKGLKRKLEESRRSEAKEMARCKARLEHLAQHPHVKTAAKTTHQDKTDDEQGTEKTTEAETEEEVEAEVPTRDPVDASGGDEAETAAAQRWLKSRTHRFIVDHMLRNGHLASAASLAKEAQITNLVDVEIFASAQAAIDGLERRDCSMALSWCASHRQRLHKLKSTLEFELRLQEFIEMVRGGRCKDAISYARKHLAPMAVKEPSHMPAVQQAMGALAFPATVDKPLPYRELFDDERWEDLIYEFRQEHHRLHVLPPHSLLAIATQAGLSSLKTQFCYGADDGRSNECPVCVEGFGQLAGPLPSSLRTKSCVRCQVTGEQFDDDNYAPYALPNGHVYSRKALEQLAMAEDGMITDPATGEKFAFVQAKKAFIV